MKLKNSKNRLPVIIGLVSVLSISFTASKTADIYASSASHTTTASTSVESVQDSLVAVSNTSSKASKSLPTTQEANATVEELSTEDTLQIAQENKFADNENISITEDATSTNIEKGTAEITVNTSVESSEINENADFEIEYIEMDEAEEEVDNIYKYCPTSINGTVLYCSNEADPGEVKDGINLNGKLVLTTTPGDWDSAQVCDPSVISGNFIFGGQSYTYLMAYLGCATYDCTVNEVGFAVSNNLYNWTKIGRVVEAEKDGCWGVGQPCLMSYNNTVYLFYTSGTIQKTTTYASVLSDTNFDNGVNVSSPVEITCSYDSIISNADFAFSGTTLYMTCDTHPFPEGDLGFISAVQSVYEGQWDGTLEGLATIDWTITTQIGSAVTGHERNHNGCFSRNGDGSLASRTLLVTTGDVVGDFNANLWTYEFISTSF